MEQQLRRNLIFNTLGSLLFYVCQAAITLLVTALAGAQANGMLATAMTISNVCLSVASYGMRTFQVSDLEGKYTDRTYLRSRWVTLAVAGFGCLAFALANSYSAQQRWVILLYTAYRLVESWSDVWHAFLQRAERMDLVGISFGVRGLVTAGVVSGGLFFTKNLVLTLALLAALNGAYVLLVDLPLAKKRADLQRTGGATTLALLTECLPLAVYAALNTTIASVPRYFCERQLGTVKMGYFNNVFLPVMILQVAVIYLFVPFITTFARLWTSRDKAGFYRGLRMLGLALAALWAAGAVGVALLGRWGLCILYPATPEVLQYTPLLQPLVLATVCTVLATVLCHLLTIARAMKGLILGNLAGLFAALAVSVPLIARFDVYGAAYATIVGIGVQSAALLLFLLGRCRQQFAAD
ncbi:lipopolysaccharide biosynthesis protein [uncultured Allofournierella sp.]|uniref:lipopolysaccharide biosynthesis protein n=1 Tax=uncultured Allofournierella sp. TaxID=1940258 RepID=UPI0037510A0B